PSRIPELARRQDGLITRSQAIAAGLTSTQVNGHLRIGRWVRVLPEVYSTDRAAIGPIPFTRAVSLWAGPDSVIEDEAALIWQGRFDSPLTQVTVSCGCNLRAPEAAWPIRVRRHVVHEFWRVHWNNIVTVRSEFAIAQLLPEMGPALLDDAVRRRWVTVDTVAEVHRCLCPGRGSAIRSVILTAAEGGAISEAERILHRHLHAAGIRGWRANASARLGSVNRTGDVVFEEIRLLVGVDGFAFHTDHERYQSDRLRQNEFAVAGWTVLRFTWWTLTKEPERAVQDIQATIARLRGR
ncbi:MAG TPA: type IV toxin-antitoxin system AbiEi family antitoxin domain-containing protein, partial [Nakamurella sp.]